MMNKIVADANSPVPDGTHLPLLSVGSSPPVPMTIAPTMNSITTVMEMILRVLYEACQICRLPTFLFV
jgi:hypothetical protein